MNSNNFLSTLTHPGTEALLCNRPTPPMPPIAQAFTQGVMRELKRGDHTTRWPRGGEGYWEGGPPIGEIREVTIGVSLAELTEAQ